MSDNSTYTNQQHTFDMTNIREDLGNTIWEVSPTETPFISAIGKAKATSRLHEFLSRDLRAAVTTNAHQEGERAAATLPTQPTKLNNRTQIFSEVVSVSGTGAAVDAAGQPNVLGEAIAQSGLACRLDMEKTMLFNQAKVTAASGQTAGKLAGAISWIKTNVNMASDGTSPTGDGTDVRQAGSARAFTNTLLDDVLEQCEENTGPQPKLLFMHPKKVVMVPSFGANQTRMGNAASKVMTNAVEIYEGPFGRYTIVSDRLIDPSFVLAINPTYWKVAELRPWQTRNLGVLGDSDEKMIVAEVTLEARNEKSSGIVADLS